METKKPRPSTAPDWHPADVVAAIRKRGTTLRQLSLSSGLAAGTLREALRRPYFAAEQIIASFLACEAAEIWPSRYPCAGIRRSAKRDAVCLYRDNDIKRDGCADA